MSAGTERTLPTTPERKNLGQEAYARDVAGRPLYHDGSPRPAWDQLPEWAQWSWGRGL